MDFPLKTLFDEILVQFTLSGSPVSPKKILFWGERAGAISSYVAGWMAGKGIDVIVLDGANRFDPYMVSSFFAKKALIPPEGLLKRIRIARAFTCYQMATLMGEQLPSLLRQEGATAQPKKLSVILLGPITTFLDEDVPEREVRPLFERSLRKIEEMAIEGTPFLLFQPNSSPLPARRQAPNRAGSGQAGAKGGTGGLKDAKRMHLMKRLFQFSDLVWRICLDDQGTKMILEKGIEMVSHCERSPAPHGVQGEVKQSQGIASSPRDFGTPRNDNPKQNRITRSNITLCAWRYALCGVYVWVGQYFLSVGFWKRRSRSGGSFEGG